VGPAYSLLAGFEIVPAKDLRQSPVGPVEFLLRYKASADHSPHEISEQPQLTYTPFQQLPQSQRFAGAVVLFGSLLRGSKHVKNVSWNDVLEMGKTSVDKSSFAQVEFLGLVEQAKKLYGKKRK
jgi:Ca-activated chloride channel homolog